MTAKGFSIFLAGAAVGSLATYIFLNNRVKENLNKAMEDAESKIKELRDERRSLNVKLKEEKKKSEKLEKDIKDGVKAKSDVVAESIIEKKHYRTLDNDRKDELMNKNTRAAIIDEETYDSLINGEEGYELFDIVEYHPDTNDFRFQNGDICEYFDELNIADEIKENCKTSDFNVGTFVVDHDELKLYQIVRVDEDEIKANETTDKEPYIIDEEMFEENNLDFDQKEITYYIRDDVFVDEDGVDIDEPETTFGYENILRIGLGQTRYIRNELLETDYKIVRSEEVRV